MTSTETVGGTGQGTQRGFDAKMPKTRLGRVSMWLALAFVIMFVVNIALMDINQSAQTAAQVEWRQAVLPFYGIAMLLVGLSAGIVGLIAIVKQKERSLLTLLTIIPGLWVITFVIGEFLFPH